MVNVRFPCRSKCHYMASIGIYGEQSISSHTSNDQQLNRCSAANGSETQRNKSIKCKRHAVHTDTFYIKRRKTILPTNIKLDREQFKENAISNGWSGYTTYIYTLVRGYNHFAMLFFH